MTDIAIVGAGPAGVSAALTAVARGRSVLLVSNNPQHSPLAKAERIDNYPGVAKVVGSDLVAQLESQVHDTDAIEFIEGRVTSVMPFGERFMLSVGSDAREVGCVILCTGVAAAKAYPGEAELLGKGVSYCATCDGMLYRGRPVVVAGLSDEAVEEANFLAGIGCEVTFVSKKEVSGLVDGIVFEQGAVSSVSGDEKVTGVEVGEKSIPADAVFVLRPAIAPSALLYGLETEGAFIKVNADMETNVPGVFAAGDCVGKPLQIAKAVGQGQIAAFSADAFLA